ncbi:MAG TPA: RNA methyltransferase [Rhizobiales bacterium]|nr:RNA methyltransferase [Hyphomicrobiales bacterium]
MGLAKQRGFFGIGAEGISKPLNFGNLVRSAHAFGASFVFTVDPDKRIGAVHSDTSRTPLHVPCFSWKNAKDMNLPQGCRLVGVELLDEAVDLPSFRHPGRAAYVLGAERGSLSPAMLEKCDLVVKIPTAFCINLAVAGAIVMYDRIKTLGRFAPPPVSPGGKIETLPEHVQGKVTIRTES